MEEFLVRLGWRRVAPGGRRSVEIQIERGLVGAEVDGEVYLLVGRDLARVVDIEKEIE